MSEEIRVAPPQDENCDVCDSSLQDEAHVEIETVGYLLRLCQSCSAEVGELGEKAAAD